MHTENIPGLNNTGRLDDDTRRVYLDGDVPLPGHTAVSASFEGKLNTSHVDQQPNTYTMGNLRDHEPIMTEKSMS